MLVDGGCILRNQVSPRFPSAPMNSLVQIAHWEGLILLAGIFGIVFWRILTGGISLGGLLLTHDDKFSPGRAQLLVFTMMFAVRYVLQVVKNPTAFPDMPAEWIAILGGSHAVYLGGKARSMLFGKDSS